MDCYDVFLQLLNQIEETTKLMNEYDELPHNYGQDILYQAESHVIQIIGENKGIKVTDIANIMGKTTSACSQIIRKLRKKDWVRQERNEQNNREYNLSLTEHGWQIYKEHEEFDKRCYRRNFEGIQGFTLEELKICLEFQIKIAEGFRQDVIDSKSFVIEELSV